MKHSDRLLLNLQKYFPSTNTKNKINILFGQIEIIINFKNLKEVITALYYEKQFSFGQLIDICGIDYPHKKNRYEVVYQLLSLEYNQRIRVKAALSSHDIIDSIINIYPCANWWEREVWDMYGIKFKNHPCLERILTDYDFKGHPLRKDFPLSGYTQKQYDENKKIISSSPVHLTQEYRNFDTLSPWNEERVVLPGDEKGTGYKK